MTFRQDRDQGGHRGLHAKPGGGPQPAQQRPHDRGPEAQEPWPQDWPPHQQLGLARRQKPPVKGEPWPQDWPPHQQLDLARRQKPPVKGSHTVQPLKQN